LLFSLKLSSKLTLVSLRWSVTVVAVVVAVTVEVDGVEAEVVDVEVVVVVSLDSFTPPVPSADGTNKGRW